MSGRVIIVRLVVQALALLTANASVCAGIDSSMLGLRYRDTLQVQEGSSTLTNKIFIENLSVRDTQHLRLEVFPDAGWKTMSASQHIVLAPRAKRIAIISLMTDNMNPGGLWSGASFRISQKGGKDPLTRHFAIRRQPSTRFSFRARSQEEVLFAPGETERVLQVSLHNEGNIPMGYVLDWSLNALNVFSSIGIRLEPGKDTIYEYKLKLHPQDVQRLNANFLRVHVKDDSNNTSDVSFKLSYFSQHIKDHESSYATVPITVTTGVMSRNYDLTNAFVTVNGSVDFSKNTRLRYYYRSKDYLITNRYQQDLFFLDLTGRHFRLYAGQAQRNNDFAAFGNEISASARWGKWGGVSLWGIKTYAGTYNSTNQAGASLAYGWGKTHFEHALIGALDSFGHLHAAVLMNKFYLINSKHVVLSATGGVGSDLKASENITAQLSKASPGYSLNYTMAIGNKWLALNSSMTSNSERYPGVYRGMQMADHSLLLNLIRGWYVAPFYSSNKVTNNFGIDTLLNSNRINFNMERYGLRSGITGKRGQASVEAGYYKNTSMTMLPVYRFAGVGFDYQGKKNFQFSFKSQGGLAKNELTGLDNVWFNTSRISAGNRLVNFSGTYFRYPTYQVDRDPAETFNESMSLVSSLRFHLFKRMDGNVGYELARYTLNNMLTHNSVVHLSFRGLKNGLRLELDGSIPLTAPNRDNLSYLASRNYMQLSLSKAFNVPVITKKRYFDIKLRLFIDTNGNGVQDNDEPGLDESLVSINSRLMVTDARGCIRYHNASPGIYQIDLTKIVSKEGYIPARGYKEIIDLTKDMTLDVPFRLGRQITGRVNFELDNYSNDKYTPDGLKVIVKDTSGNVIGHAITDDDGKFTYTVAAGTYKISLNPAAFTEKMFPVQMEFPADLISREACHIVFEVKQKKREIRILNKKQENRK